MRKSLLPRSARSARLLLRVAAEHGLSFSDCLHATGLAEDDLADPSAEISAAQEIAIVRNLVARLEPGIGLTAGGQYSIEMFGMFGFACMSAPTLRETVEIALRYQNLAFTLAEADLVAAADSSCIVVGATHLPTEIRRFATDHCMATVWSTLRDISDTISISILDFDYAQDGEADRYRAQFGTSPRFNQPASRIGFHTHDLDQPRELVDVDAMRECERQCRELLARREALVGTAGSVRERLTRTVDAIPPMPEMASDLFLSTRTLRRRLELEGTSYRELIDDVRRHQADNFLAAGLSVNQVAHRLGYGSSSAFVHAYKRWCGRTPRRGAHLHSSLDLAKRPDWTCHSDA